ncbi:MAG TPA: molybdopterin-dependent oxidoreductase [Candidatus Binataceae bacterium]|nr:molybdopterin-dependent oxidoreductase [Candidatus Binataceae bacterium]
MAHPDRPPANARRDPQTERAAYFEWDACKWGTHRVNCYPGSCPFRIYVKDDKVVREEISCTYPEFADPDDRVPDYNPRGCQKGYQHSRAMYGPDRVLHPMKRAGERGSGKWERISWAQAFDEVGAKMADVIQKYGAKALLDDHAANGIGVFRGAAEGSTTGITSLLGGISLDLDFVTGDFKSGQWLTFGEMHHAPGIENWFLPDTIILMSNPVYANIPDVHYLLEARYRGAKIIAVAPDKNPSCQFADIWVPIKWSADPALWLGVCKILIDNGWIDRDFVAEQTDAPILVRADDGRYLRDSDLRANGDPEQFYAVGSESGELVQLPKGTLERPCGYELEATRTVKLADGKSVEVSTVFTLLRKRLEQYTPENVHEMAGVHPDMLREVAELCRPPRKIFGYMNFLAGKLYHGDLLERSYCYVLALTGSVGRAGTGTQGWSPGTEAAASMSAIAGMPKQVIESAEPIAAAATMSQLMMEDYKMRLKMDPTMPPVEAANGAMREGLKASGVLTPGVFLWYRHAGYKEVWDKFLEDPNAPRKISEYAEDAVSHGWWKGFDHEVTPRAMLVSGSNPLRRHRGGMNTYIKTLWPKLELIVVFDTRWSTTGLYSDYVLPAASYYEYADAKYSTPDTRLLCFTDQSVPMLGESKSDRQIALGVLAAVARHLKARGIDKYKAGEREVIVDDLYWRATYGGRYGETNDDEERLVDDCFKALGQMGWLSSINDEELSLENIRRTGKAWLSGRPPWHGIVCQSSDMVPQQVHVPMRDQVERKVPYATTTRRIQLYVDHPYFIEADEQLVRYKQPPNIGGRQPLRMTGGHVRWSIHANWHTSEEMLKLHRGEPFAFINDTVATEKGIGDHDFIRVFNDYGEFLVRAKRTACVRPDQLVIYHAWEPYQHPNGMPQDGIMPGPPKGLHFAGGYRHFEYTLFSWAPTQNDRQTNISFERAGFQG